jgi:alpha-1,2-mannosyltransferase
MWLDRRTLPERLGRDDVPVRAVLPVVACVALLAAGVRALVLAQSGGPSGLLGYDQGVYFAASEALAWGHLPYRDFLFLHPPGVILALAPLGSFARLTHDSWGIEAARVAAVLLGAANAALVTLAARRAGLVAAATTGAFYAVWRPVAVTETETRLEPFVTLGLLVALAVLATTPDRLRRRALVLAGCGLGFALTVKIWAVVPVAVVLVWFVVRFGPRAAAWVAGPLVATGVVVCLPFLLAAPSSMFRMVVLDQVSRGRMSSTLAERTTGVLGLSSVVGHRPHLEGPLLLLLAAGVVLLVLTWVRVPSARVAVILLVAQGGVVLASPSYFRYYDAYPAPALALCVGAAATAVLGLPARSGPPVVRRVAAVTVACGLLLALGAVAGSDEDAVVGRPFPAARLRAVVSHARCVTADSVGALVQLDVFGRDLRRGCPVVVDVGGLSHDRDAAALVDGRQSPRLTDLRWQRDVSGYLRSGEAQVLVRRRYDGFDRATIRGLHRARMRLDGGVFAVYGR